MNKSEVAEILEQIGILLDLQGENPFKIRAYENAAHAIQALPDELDIYIRDNTLTEIKGVGKAIAEKITQLVTMGRLEYYEKLKASIPHGLVEMTRIPNLGPKRVKIIHEKLKIETIAQLEEACRNERIAELEGFGEKSQEKILAGIKALRKYSEKHLFSVAEDEANRILEMLKDNKQIIRINCAGSLRRKREVIGDLDFVASTSKSDAVMDAFVSMPGIQNVVAKGDTKSTITLASGINADLRTVTDKEFPYALHHLTGSKEHNIAMRARAIRMGMKMNEYGLFKGEKLIPVNDEIGLFGKLGLAYIEPELREDTGEIEAAEKGTLPKLVEEKDIRGILHAHTTYSDGRNTIAEMAEAARATGMEYLGLAEHSQSVAYAGGLKSDDIKRQHKEIDELNEKLAPFRILKGIEVDILPDGMLDYNNKILQTFDFVIAAVHSKFNMTEEDMTERIIEAFKNKYVTMLAHPTGRLLLEREPYPVNMKAVIDAAVEYDKVIELNANPHRFDLDWRLCKYAKEKGVKVSINPDAHNTGALKEIRYGVGIARKGWLEKGDVLNTMRLKELAVFLRIKLLSLEEENSEELLSRGLDGFDFHGGIAGNRRKRNG
jgi:DNA polymerase (family X)